MGQAESAPALEDVAGGGGDGLARLPAGTGTRKSPARPTVGLFGKTRTESAQMTRDVTVSTPSTKLSPSSGKWVIGGFIPSTGKPAQDMVSLAKTLPTTAPAIVEVTILAACASPILSFSASSCSVALLFPLVLKTRPFFVFFSPIGLAWDKKEPSCTAAFGAPGAYNTT